MFRVPQRGWSVCGVVAAMLQIRRLACFVCKLLMLVHCMRSSRRTLLRSCIHSATACEGAAVSNDHVRLVAAIAPPV